MPSDICTVAFLRCFSNVLWLEASGGPKLGLKIVEKKKGSKTRRQNRKKKKNERKEKETVDEAKIKPEDERRYVCSFHERKAQGRGVISKTGRNQRNWNDSPLSFPNVEENRVLSFPFSSLSRAQCHAIKLSLISFLCSVFHLFHCCNDDIIRQRFLVATTEISSNVRIYDLVRLTVRFNETNEQVSVII